MGQAKIGESEPARQEVFTSTSSRLFLKNEDITRLYVSVYHPSCVSVRQSIEQPEQHAKRVPELFADRQPFGISVEQPEQKSEQKSERVSVLSPERETQCVSFSFPECVSVEKAIGQPEQ